MTETSVLWKRFRYPRGEHIDLADDGFLVDPDSEYGKYHNTEVRPFDWLDDTPCTVLLGEPGMAKP